MWQGSGDSPCLKSGDVCGWLAHYALAPLGSTVPSGYEISSWPAVREIFRWTGLNTRRLQRSPPAPHNILMSILQIFGNAWVDHSSQPEFWTIWEIKQKSKDGGQNSSLCRDAKLAVIGYHHSQMSLQRLTSRIQQMCEPFMTAVEAALPGPWGPAASAPWRAVELGFSEGSSVPRGNCRAEGLHLIILPKCTKPFIRGWMECIKCWREAEVGLGKIHPSGISGR